MSRVGRRSAAITAVVVPLMAVAGASVLWAHAALVASRPAKGERLRMPPDVIRLEFNETVRPATSRVELVAPDSLRQTLPLRQDPAADRVLLAEVPRLESAGSYRVAWRLVGPDGHAVTGEFDFVVDSIPVAPASPPVEAAPRPARESGRALGQVASDAPLQVLVRFLAILGITLVIGSVAFSRVVLGRLTDAGQAAIHGFREAVDSNLRRLIRIGAWIIVPVALVRLGSQAVALGGSLGNASLGDLWVVATGSRWGLGWFVLVAGALLTIGSVRSAGGSMRWPVAAAGALLLTASASMMGHAAAAPRLPALAMTLDAVHVLAAGGWGGGIIAMSLAALPSSLRLPAHTRVEVLRLLLRAFTPLALASAAVLAVTGAAAALIQLGSLSVLLETSYGLALVRKVVLVLAIAGIGAYHWRVVPKSIGGGASVSRLRLSTAIDAALVLAVLVLTAVLTGTAPPPGAG